MKKILKFAGRVTGFGVIAWTYGLCYEQGSKLGKNMEVMSAEKIKASFGQMSMRALALADRAGLIQDENPDPRRKI